MDICNRKLRLETSSRSSCLFSLLVRVPLSPVWHRVEDWFQGTTLYPIASHSEQGEIDGKI